MIKFGRLTTGVVIGAAALAFSVAHADTEVSGFAKPKFHWNKDSASAKGFHLSDGAIYVSHKEGAANVMVDVGYTSAGLTLDQAYYSREMDGMTCSLGTKDSPFGFEKNDGNAIAFTGHGALYSVMPMTQTGLTLGAGLGPANVKLLVAETNSETSRTAGTPGSNPDVGLQLGFGMGDNMDMSLGYLYVKGSGDANGLVDFVFNMKGDGMTLGLGFDYFMEGYNGLAEAGWGLVAQGLFNVADGVDAGLRFDMLSKVGNEQLWDLTVGPQFKVTDALKVKVDYTMTSTTAVSGGTASTSHAAAVAGVYNF